MFCTTGFRVLVRSGRDRNGPLGRRRLGIMAVRALHVLAVSTFVAVSRHPVRACIHCCVLRISPLLITEVELSRTSAVVPDTSPGLARLEPRARSGPPRGSLAVAATVLVCQSHFGGWVWHASLAVRAVG